MAVLVGIVALVATIMILWWLARTILDSPRIMQRFFQTRKQDRGYKALSKGLIAANSGDAAGARRYTKESIRLLGQEPLVNLLDAQSLLLEGNRDEARKRFEGMLDNDDTRLVALRGLYLEAERQGAGEAARHYAGEAHKAAPTLGWAGNAKLRYASLDGDWEAALASLEANRSAGLVGKETAKRQRAVLLTAQAMSVEPADPVKAAKLAREAHKLAPDLVPAAIIGAKALARNSDIARASGMLETVWKKQPHPEIGQSYIHLRLGDSAIDRLKRARKLAAMKANHTEGNFLIAEAAINVQDWKLARESMVPVLTTAPSERACLIMADIEEGQSGDQGRMRDWLSRAVRAPKDAAWTADGYISDKWLPISPVSGKLDAFEWKRPVEQLGASTAAVLDNEGLADLISEPPKAPVVVTGSTVETEKPAPQSSASGEKRLPADGSSRGAIIETVDAETDIAPGQADKDVAFERDVEDVINSKAEEVKPAPADAVDRTEDLPETIAQAGTPTKIEFDKEPAEPAKNSAVDTVTGSSEKPTPPARTGTVDAKFEIKGLKEKEGSFDLGRRPDDPGVRDGDGPKKPKRFGLF